MGHVNFTTLKQMSDKNLAVGLPKINIPTRLCEGYLIVKQNRNPYPTSTMFRASKRLELVHGDLCGPITPPTLAGNKYFLLPVDGYTRVMWIYLLKAKDEALKFFKEFQKKVETEVGEKIKTLRTYRGGGGNSSQVNSPHIVKKRVLIDINRHYTTPYSPQQNGVVERRNHTIIEINRSNPKSMDVPEVLWGEAVGHAVYILNRLDTKALKDSTPYEMWTGRKPQVEHLRVFGCIAYVRTPNTHLMKLEDRSSKMVHISIEKGSKAYRLLDPDTGTIRVRRDVKFDEEAKWIWEKRSKNKTHSRCKLNV